jgi:hypothetical protein
VVVRQRLGTALVKRGVSKEASGLQKGTSWRWWGGETVPTEEPVLLKPLMANIGNRNIHICVSLVNEHVASPNADIATDSAKIPGLFLKISIAPETVEV